MRGRYGRLPSTQALAGFEAAGRLLSFSRAAEELSMTQSAISHQIRGLEQQLGMPLFRRQGRSIELTDAGRDLWETARRTLATLESGLKRLEFFVKPGSVVIACPPAWARHWLMPRLPALRRAHPDIEPWIVTAEQSVDFEHTEMDCFITYGDGHWPGLESRQLWSEELAPFCAPRLAKAMGKRPRPARLLSQDLLHDESWEGWGAWFRAAGVEQSVPVRGLNFSDPGLLLDCAADGQGVALASIELARHLERKGILQRMFKQSVPTGLGWHVVGDPERLQREEAQVFWHWLLSQAAPGNVET